MQQRGAERENGRQTGENATSKAVRHCFEHGGMAFRPSGKVCCAIIRRFLPTTPPDQGRNDFGGRAGSCPFPCPDAPMTPRLGGAKGRTTGSVVSFGNHVDVLYFSHPLLAPELAVHCSCFAHTPVSPEPALQSGIPIHVGAARRRAGHLPDLALGRRDSCQRSSRSRLLLLVPR